MPIGARYAVAGISAGSDDTGAANACVEILVSSLRSGLTNAVCDMYWALGSVDSLCACIFPAYAESSIVSSISFIISGKILVQAKVQCTESA
jgi:hypothetical protein